MLGMTTRTLLWQAADGIGLEHVLLTEDSKGVSVESNVIGIEENRPFCLHYQVQCDGRYQVRSVEAQVVGGSSLSLWTDGHGHWFDAQKQPITSIFGCVDVDITATPFTNTLPIRRVAWEVGEQQKFLMAYILAPTLEIYADQQHYTCLVRRDSGSIFLFESMSTGFTAQIVVDADGLVVDYSGLFKRVTPTL
jgi:uncharacterized protein